MRALRAAKPGLTFCEPEKLIADQNLAHRRLDRAHASVAGEQFLVTGDRVPRVLRSFAVFEQSQADLAAAWQCAERAAFPSQHRSGAVRTEAAELERLAVHLLQRSNPKAELQSLGCDPLRLAVDGNHLRVAVGRLVVPEHLK